MCPDKCDALNFLDGRVLADLLGILKQKHFYTNLGKRPFRRAEIQTEGEDAVAGGEDVGVEGEQRVTHSEAGSDKKIEKKM
uniref:Uncharacterized protein n=1 Tax=Globodera rostochiensis TaxID=31243 RepID=A0A914ICT1_GLORO